jgi:hypothetical protein
MQAEEVIIPSGAAVLAGAAAPTCRCSSSRKAGPAGTAAAARGQVRQQQCAPKRSNIGGMAGAGGACIRKRFKSCRVTWGVMSCRSMLRMTVLDPVVRS